MKSRCKEERRNREERRGRRESQQCSNRQRGRGVGDSSLAGARQSRALKPVTNSKSRMAGVSKYEYKSKLKSKLCAHIFTDRTGASSPTAVALAQKSADLRTARQTFANQSQGMLHVPQRYKNPSEVLISTQTVQIWCPDLSPVRGKPIEAKLRIAIQV